MQLAAAWKAGGQFSVFEMILRYQKKTTCVLSWSVPQLRKQSIQNIFPKIRFLATYLRQSEAKHFGNENVTTLAGRFIGCTLLVSAYKGCTFNLSCKPPVWPLTPNLDEAFSCCDGGIFHCPAARLPPTTMFAAFRVTSIPVIRLLALNSSKSRSPPRRVSVRRLAAVWVAD